MVKTIFLTISLLILTEFASAFPAPNGAENCVPDMSTLTKAFADQVAADAEGRKKASEARVQKMTEKVLNEIRVNSDTPEALERAVDKLREELAIRPQDAKSGLLQESVGKLKEYGANTQTILDDALDLGRKVGAVKVMGGKDGVFMKGLKKIPLLKNWVQNAQERNQSGMDAINNLTEVVNNQVSEIRRVDGLAKQDLMNWSKEFQDLWEKAEELAAIREAVTAASESQDSLTPLQKRAYESFIDELDAAELIYKDQAEDLQQQVLMNITVQKSLKETQKGLQTKSKSQLRKLANFLANMAGQDTAIKGQDLMAKIDEGVVKAENTISEAMLESTQQMTETLKKIGDRTKTAEAREKRRQSDQKWKDYDEQIRSIRAERKAELKDAYDKGNQEIQDHEIRSKTSAAVLTEADPVSLEPARVEAPEQEESRPQVRPQ